MNHALIPEAAVLSASVFFATVLLLHALIPALRRRKADQPILTIGPSWHLSKAGTPTMGGLAFAAAALLAAALYGFYLVLTDRSGEARLPALMLGYALLCGGIGFVDDFCKLAKRHNQGLTAPQKYFLQLVVSALFLFFLRRMEMIDTHVSLPFSDVSPDLGFWYYPLALLFLTGVVNALNLTDGVDGLLASTVAVLSAFFLLWGLRDGIPYLVALGAILLGASLGFLVYNVHPAKIFMGDTGSLFFGGAVAAAGIVTAAPLVVLLAGAVYVLEAASVILQVLYFKLTGGKRLFRMAPLHHHLEKSGWSENAIVALFAAVTALSCALAFAGR